MRLNFRSFHNKKRVEQKVIYDQCHRKLYFTALRILGDQFEAEEVMHDTLLKYFSHEKEFASQNERDKWMTRVCVNLSIDLIRKRRAVNLKLESFKRESIEEEQITIEDNGRECFKGVTVDIIKEALSNLSQGYRTVLSLNLFEGYDYQEIAQILEIKEVSVRTQFLRAKAKLVANIENIKEKQKAKNGTY